MESISNNCCIFDFVEGTHARKYSNKFGISLAYSYLCTVKAAIKRAKSRKLAFELFRVEAGSNEVQTD